MAGAGAGLQVWALVAQRPLPGLPEAARLSTELTSPSVLEVMEMARVRVVSHQHKLFLLALRLCTGRELLTRSTFSAKKGTH